HVAQLFADSRSVHVKDDRRERARFVGTGREARLAAVLGDDANFSLDHRYSAPYSIRRVKGAACHFAAASSRARAPAISTSLIQTNFMKSSRTGLPDARMRADASATAAWTAG